MRPFILEAAPSSSPAPPPSLSSSDWVSAFNEVEGLRQREQHSPYRDETNIAKFWSANVPGSTTASYATSPTPALDLIQTARLAAMVNVVAADAGISVMYAKYHYLFWRPVTAIDPTSVTADGFGPRRITTTATQRPWSSPAGGRFS